MEFECVALGKIGDEKLVLVGVGSAKLMVDVGDGEDKSDFGAEIEKEMKQRDGVSAAGDSDGNAVSGADETMAVDRL
jgi:hypothetical protein